MPEEARCWPLYTDETVARVAELVRTGPVFDYAGRAPVTELEEEFSELHPGAHVVSFNSGTSALFAAFFALGLGDGDEVVVPDLTFLASASPLLWLGATPVLADAHPSEPNVDVERVAAVLTPRTKAVLVTHLFGHPVDVDPLVSLCRDRGLRMIEDCSHAHASRIGTRHVGRFGDIAVYSISAGKMVSGGHGGLLVTTDPVLRDLAMLLGHFKPRTRTDLLTPGLRTYAEFALGGNLRLSPLSAVLALDHLRRLDELSADRVRNVEILATAFEGLVEPVASTAPRVNGTYFDVVFSVPPSRIDQRDEIVEALRAAGVDARPPATRPLHLQLVKIAGAGAQRKHPIVARLLDLAGAVRDVGGFPNASQQHDRMISFCQGKLFQPDGAYAALVAERSVPVLQRLLCSAP